MYIYIYNTNSFKFKDSDDERRYIGIGSDNSQGIFLPRETRNSLCVSNNILNTCDLLSTAIQYNAEKMVSAESLSHSGKVRFQISLWCGLPRH